jgi:ABC-type transport system involved in multi-copper enzyme maturation permease subunit
MKALALFRFKILLKQKLGIAMLVAGVFFFPFALFLAFSSYVRPDKIYWDLSSSFSFMMSILLASYLGSHLFQEEKERKTLSLLLSTRFSRSEWISGNILGIATLLALCLLAWTTLLCVGSWLAAKSLPPNILFQSQALIFFESLIFLSFAFLLSLYLKPLLSWLSLLSAGLLLHSKTHLEQLLVENTFEGLSRWLYKGVLFILNFFPPLEWWDIRIFIGFHGALEWEQFFFILLLSLAWIYVALFLARRKMEKMDL